MSDQHAGPQEPQQFTSDLDDITSWFENVIPMLESLPQSEPAVSIEDMAVRATELKVNFKNKHSSFGEKHSVFVFILMGFLLQEMQKVFTRYKSIMLSVNLRAHEAPEIQDRLAAMNQGWSRACTGLQQWDTSLRKTLMRCQVGNTKHLQEPVIQRFLKSCGVCV